MNYNQLPGYLSGSPFGLSTTMPGRTAGAPGYTPGYYGGSGGGSSVAASSGAGSSSAYQAALAQYNQQSAAAQQRADADRAQMLQQIQQLQNYTQNFQQPQVQNPYTPQWLAASSAQQEDQRARQLQASESALTQQYASMGRTVDPRMLAMLRNTVMQQGNADTRDLQIGSAGNSFNASVAQNNAQQQYNNMLLGNQSQSLQMLYNVMANTQYGPDPNQLALIMQLGQQAALAPSTVGSSYAQPYTPPSYNPPVAASSGAGRPLPPTIKPVTAPSAQYLDWLQRTLGHPISATDLGAATGQPSATGSGAAAPAGYHWERRNTGGPALQSILVKNP